MENYLLLLLGLAIIATVWFLLDKANNLLDKSIKQGAEHSYNKVSPQMAKEMMVAQPDHILLDVRTTQEFVQKRIPGALLIPHTQIKQRAAAELPDKNKPIFVYCHSGGRSAKAAKMLFGLGYTKVYDFGGAVDWPYEIESTNAQ